MLDNQEPGTGNENVQNADSESFGNLFDHEDKEAEKSPAEQYIEHLEKVLDEIEGELQKLRSYEITDDLFADVLEDGIKAAEELRNDLEKEVVRIQNLNRRRDAVA